MVGEPIGEVLGRARRLAGLDIDGAAAALDVPVRRLKRIERGKERAASDLVDRAIAGYGAGVDLPSRTALLADELPGVFLVGTERVSFDLVRHDNRTILVRYLAAVRRQRGLDASEPVELRSVDVVALAGALDLAANDLTRELRDLAGLSKDRARRTALVLVLTGLAAVAIGATSWTGAPAGAPSGESQQTAGIGQPVAVADAGAAGVTTSSTVGSSTTTPTRSGVATPTGRTAGGWIVAAATGTASSGTAGVSAQGSSESSDPIDDLDRSVSDGGRSRSGDERTDRDAEHGGDLIEGLAVVVDRADDPAGPSTNETPAAPTVEAPVVGEPTAEAPEVGQPTVEAPVVGEPTAEAPEVRQPTVEAPVVGEPTVEAPDAGESDAVASPAESAAAAAPVASDPDQERVDSERAEQERAEQEREQPLVDESDAGQPKAADHAEAAKADRVEKARAERVEKARAERAERAARKHAAKADRGDEAKAERTERAARKQAAKDAKAKATREAEARVKADEEAKANAGKAKDAKAEELTAAQDEQAADAKAEEASGRDAEAKAKEAREVEARAKADEEAKAKDAKAEQAKAAEESSRMDPAARSERRAEVGQNRRATGMRITARDDAAGRTTESGRVATDRKAEVADQSAQELLNLER